MPTTEIATYARIAEALAEAFPSAVRPSVAPAQVRTVGADLTDRAVVATFVGDRSADLAVVVADPSSLIAALDLAARLSA